jgi:hypothetical protein
MTTAFRQNVTLNAEWEEAVEEDGVEPGEDLIENHDGILVEGAEGVGVAGEIVVMMADVMEGKTKYGERHSLMNLMNTGRLDHSPPLPLRLHERPVNLMAGQLLPLIPDSCSSHLRYPSRQAGGNFSNLRCNHSNSSTLVPSSPLYNRTLILDSHRSLE